MYKTFILKISNFIYNNYYFKYKVDDIPRFFIKLEYIYYLRIYFIYLFLYYLKKRYIFDYSICLHSQYIIHEIYNNIETKIKYKSNYDMLFLKDITDNTLFYLFGTSLYFDNQIKYYHKIFIFGNICSFYFLHKLHELYKKRIHCIENNIEFKDPLKILFFNPNIKYLKNFINSTKIFDLFHFNIFLNIILILFY